MIYYSYIYNFNSNFDTEYLTLPLIIKLHNFYEQADNKLFNRYFSYIKKDNQFLLRIGRYCGKDFIVKNLNDKDKPKTKSLFRKQEKDNKSELPFGWVLCEIL